MTELENELERWRRYVYGSNDEGKAASPDDYKSTMIHETWSHKWKWFRPPMWKIFRWAFNIDRKVFTGVYPVGIGGDMTMRSNMPGGRVKVNQRASGDNITQIGLQFTATPYTHPEIEKTVAKRVDLAKQMADYAKSHGIHLYGDAPSSEKKEEDECSDT